MPIVCVGLSHQTAPLAVRERLAFGREELRSVLSEGCGAELLSSGITELSLVSTCNRTELYAAASDPALRDVAVRSLTGFLIRSRGLESAQLRRCLYDHAEIDAIRHLCRVAAGLDSMILGEAEVLGQVAAAHECAAEAGAAGPMLEAVFRTAIRTGRRARAETGICRNSMSVASEGVRLVGELTPVTATVLIVGTGEVGRVLGGVLRSKGYRHLTVTGRTAERTARLAEAVGASARPWHELRDALCATDVVISSTSAPHAVITHELVRSAMESREPGLPLTLVDLAVPRDVEPKVGTLPGVRLHNLDSLQSRLHDNLAERRLQVPLVEAIIEEEVRLFETWQRGVEHRPILAAMHARGEEIRKQETERVLRRLGGTDPELRRQVEALSRALVSKLLHEPSARLRQESNPVRSRLYAGAIRDLFGLDVEPSDRDVAEGERA